MNVNIKQIEALEYLLQEKYYSEFEVSDGYNQHPEHLNFYEWLYKRKLITIEELNNIKEQIKTEEE